VRRRGARTERGVRSRSAGGLRREIRLTKASALLAVAVALPSLLGGLADLTGRDHGGPWQIASGILTLAVLGFVAYGVVIHHLARIGYLERLADRRPSAAEGAGGEGPALTILVPAFKEEPAVVRKTLLSAALQGAGAHQVVLLIDDPPNPASVTDREALFASRRLTVEVASLLADLQARCAGAAAAFARRVSGDAVDLTAECEALAALYRQASAWFEARALPYRQGSHADRFFADAVLGELGRRMTVSAVAWTRRAGDPTVEQAEVEQAYRDLMGLASAEVVSFERKRYANLSHEPNKAMNLNGYLSLIIDGGCFREERHENGIVLRACDARQASFSIPVSPYVLMLDADTVLLPDYATRMLAFLRRPEHAAVAVVQAPYAAFPGASGAVERVAGATTDVQYLLHQGMTRFGAAFWVGANAVVRTAALRDVATTAEERGWTLTKVLHDRTVIEDTETTLELRRRGWSLHSYGERLAFSATPPDFGALLVQRLRWATGGLVLLPRLVRDLTNGRARPKRRTLAEAAMRVHYLISLGPMSLALLALPFCAFAGPSARALPLLALAYVAMYLRDLVRSGYCWHDVVRVYALNLLLIPVNLGGLLLSLRQTATGRKPRFLRTPKVDERTAAPGIAVVAELAMLSFWVLFAVHLILDGRVAQAMLVLLHVGLLAYAITRYIGWRAAITDLLADLRGTRRREGPAMLRGSRPEPNPS
jgi:cellulose synthase/poly-beta-1,6-N-acetylglucosamine synthase-like glycosyltransferase